MKKKPGKLDERDIPEHLIRPAIDEEKLMRIREAEWLKQQERDKSASKKRMSMAQQKMEKACNENKSDCKKRMKTAERNLKKFFEMIKVILDK